MSERRGWGRESATLPPPNLVGCGAVASRYRAHLPRAAWVRTKRRYSSATSARGTPCMFLVELTPPSPTARYRASQKVSAQAFRARTRRASNGSFQATQRSVQGAPCARNASAVESWRRWATQGSTGDCASTRRETRGSMRREASGEARAATAESSKLEQAIARVRGMTPALGGEEARGSQLRPRRHVVLILTVNSCAV